MKEINILMIWKVSLHYRSRDSSTHRDGRDHGNATCAMPGAESEPVASALPTTQDLPILKSKVAAFYTAQFYATCAAVLSGSVYKR